MSSTVQLRGAPGELAGGTATEGGGAAVHWPAVTTDDRSVIADWLVLFSALLLAISLFLTWSSLSPAYVALADRLQTLEGVARSPDAWQVYSAADVVLAVLAAALLWVALAGPRRARIVILVSCALALAFVIHALGTPPTNGAPNAFRPGPDVRAYVAPAPAPGAGETVAIIALIGAIGGLSLSLKSS
ncbi:MAG TPA: hypothetical protein VG275_12715 [Solirubrobacteraceae bacterium]|nr:hypothetical protein [Solirubrobacteraceae bacterium]